MTIASRQSQNHLPQYSGVWQDTTGSTLTARIPACRSVSRPRRERSLINSIRAASVSAVAYTGSRECRYIVHKYGKYVDEWSRAPSTAHDKKTVWTVTGWQMSGH
jgi:hypothetical protein